MVKVKPFKGKGVRPGSGSGSGSGADLSNTSFARQGLAARPATAREAADKGGKPRDGPDPASRDTLGGTPPKVGGTWTPLKIAGGLALVMPAVVITAVMLKRATDGAANDGKEFKVVRLYNKDSTSNIIVCQFKPSCDPNGIVPNDTLEFSNTGTFLDENVYAVVEKTGMRTTVEFEADQRLTDEIRKGSFILGTSIENQMDDQANKMNPGNWLVNGIKDMFNNLFGALSGPAMIGSGVCSVLICLVLVFLFVKQFSSSSRR